MEELQNNWEFQVDDSTLSQLKSVFTSSRASDTEIKLTQKSVYDTYSHIIDPHTATGFKPFILWNKPLIPTVCIETAHPIQFTSPEGVPDTQEYWDIKKQLLAKKESLVEWRDYINSPSDVDSIKQSVEQAIGLLSSK